MEHISAAQFSDRFTTMALRGHGLPKGAVDRHILWYSATLALATDRAYTEPELNDLLRGWTNRFGESVDLDHVTLRRYLIDAGYISRDAAGTTYTLVAAGLPYSFDPAIAGLDLDTLLADAIEERERRKQQHLRGTSNAE